MRGRGRGRRARTVGNDFRRRRRRSFARLLDADCNFGLGLGRLDDNADVVGLEDGEDAREEAGLPEHARRAHVDERDVALRRERGDRGARDARGLARGLALARARGVQQGGK